MAAHCCESNSKTQRTLTKSIMFGYLRQFCNILFSRSTWITVLGFLLSIFSSQVYDFVSNSRVNYVHLAVLVFSITVISGAFVFGGLEAIKQYRWKKRRFNKPFMTGILESYLDFKRKGKECEPAFCDKTPADWFNAFRSRDPDGEELFNVEKLYWKDVSSKYAALVNPFGEVYIEENRRLMTTYNRIKDFIAEGGIFICTGGFPFYYIWDHIVGRPIDTTPRTIEVIGNRIAKAPWFNESLVAKDFGVVFRNIPDKPTSTPVYQKNEDLELFGDIENEGGKGVLEFRSPWDDSISIFPALRARHENREAYPIAAVPYGEGYLIIS
ncbi:hypothetical protein MUP77_22225, partial [Candidatus Bathyarchaeota archaeon]|nr:hypothetical protein [Candidatus Bathyarchaeota archaeon]